MGIDGLLVKTGWMGEFCTERGGEGMEKKKKGDGGIKRGWGWEGTTD